MKTKRQSQCQKIYRRLKRAKGKFVSLIELWKCSGAFAVHSRCAELRKLGMVIENRRILMRGKVHSEYRLI